MSIGDAAHRAEQNQRLQDIDSYIKQYTAAVLIHSTQLQEAIDPDEFLNATNRCSQDTSPILAQICRLGREICDAAEAAGEGF